MARYPTKSRERLRDDECERMNKADVGGSSEEENLDNSICVLVPIHRLAASPLPFCPSPMSGFG